MKHKMGDVHKIQGIPCEVRFVNHTSAWLFPLKDDQLSNGEVIMKCAAMAKVNARGKITLIFRVPDNAKPGSSAV